MKTKTQKYQHKKAAHSAGVILALYSIDIQTILAPYSIHTQVILGSYSFHIIEPLQIRVAYTRMHKHFEPPVIKISFYNYSPLVILFFFNKIITKTFALRAPPFPKNPEGAPYTSIGR